jgi:hypothetical protein
MGFRSEELPRIYRIEDIDPFDVFLLDLEYDGPDIDRQDYV